ncbi:hypothetical protein DOY81_006943 [Sarcophaga bullata]|nr:hypothetical protein DOY81_006943 [Sarcophaga bullata]
MSTDAAEAVQNLELPPLRSLNDFILGSARFQLPNLKDYDKWVTFVHASLRLRNLKNKVTNTMVTLNPSTPMGVFLDAFNIAADSILS